MSETAVTRLEPPKAFRWAVLVLISLAMFGNYYVYDSISPLADVLKAQLGFSDANIGLLNAIYSFPNIVMVLVGGIVIDRIGTRRATLLFGVLCFLGAALTALSGTLAVMAAGRLVFGLGAESLIVAVTTAIAKWFRGKELSFAFGVNLTIARLGSFAALNSPSWAAPAYEGWQWPLVIGVGFATFCVSGALLYWVLEKRAEVVWSDLFRFGTSYWLVVALCITFYSAIFPFQTFAVKFFIEAHGTSREAGGFLSSLLTLFAMIFTPLFGLLVDKVGKRAIFMMLGSLLLVPVYLMMAHSRMPALVLFELRLPFVEMGLPIYLPIVMMGIAFSLIPAVMWPSVAYLVDQSKLGTAYGLMTMIQNVGLFGFNILIGWSNDHWQASAANPGGYTPGMWMFSVLGFAGLLFAWLLRRRETGPHAHGLETITTATPRG
jgi:MFS family permease